LRKKHFINSDTPRIVEYLKEAARHGLAKAGIDRMASAFEHEDLKLALGK
jgi:hypothetical protein